MGNKKMLLSGIVSSFLIIILLSGCSFNQYKMSEQSLREPANIAADPLALPRAETELGQIKILLAYYEYIPEIFADSARFDVDLFGILSDQVKLQEELREHPEFLSLWKTKKYHDFNFKVLSNGKDQTIETKQVTDLALNEWRNKIKEVLRKNINADLGKEINLILEKAGKSTSGGVLNGLILNLAKPLQVEAREMQRKGEEENLIFFLSKNLPEVLSNFKGQGVASNPKRDDLIKTYKELVSSEEKLGPLIDSYSFMNARDESASEFLKEVDQLTRQDFESLSDADFQENGIGKLLNQDQPQAPQNYLKYLKLYSSQTEVVKTEIKVNYQINIKQQNPNIGTLRGFPGGDCSSSCSFPYPNDPNEAVFYIYDENNHLKGTVTTTLLETENHEKALYVITIAGNRMNATDTEVVLQGLYREREALGVKHIILPESRQLDRLVNFSAIKSVFAKASDGKEKVAIYYQNQNIRKEIENFSSDYNSSNYDHMSENTHGHIYTPKDELNLSIDKKVFSLEQKKITVKEKIDPSAIAELIFSLNNPKRRDIIKNKIIPFAFETEEKKEAMLRMLSISDLKETVSTAVLEEELVKLRDILEINPERFSLMKYRWFYNAFLKATDAREGSNLAANIERLIKDLKNNEPPLVRGDIFKTYQKDILKYKDFQKLADSYLKEALGNDVFFGGVYGDARLSVLIDYANAIFEAGADEEKMREVKAALLKISEQNPYFYTEIKSRRLLKELIIELTQAGNTVALDRIASIVANKPYNPVDKELFKELMISTRKMPRSSLFGTLATSFSTNKDRNELLPDMIALVKDLKDEKVVVNFVYSLSKLELNHDERKKYIYELIVASEELKSTQPYVIIKAKLLSSPRDLSEVALKNILIEYDRNRNLVAMKEALATYYKNHIASNGSNVLSADSANSCLKIAQIILQR